MRPSPSTETLGSSTSDQLVTAPPATAPDVAYLEKRHQNRDTLPEASRSAHHPDMPCPAVFSVFPVESE